MIVALFPAERHEKRPLSNKEPFGSLGQKSSNFCGATQIAEFSATQRCAITHPSLVTGEEPVGLYCLKHLARPRQSISAANTHRHPTAGDSLGRTASAYFSASMVYDRSLTDLKRFVKRFFQILENLISDDALRLWKNRWKLWIM